MDFAKQLRQIQQLSELIVAVSVLYALLPSSALPTLGCVSPVLAVTRVTRSASVSDPGQHVQGSGVCVALHVQSFTTRYAGRHQLELQAYQCDWTTAVNYDHSSLRNTFPGTNPKTRLSEKYST